jgi:hypothetical protein
MSTLADKMALSISCNGDGAIGVLKDVHNLTMIGMLIFGLFSGKNLMTDGTRECRRHMADLGRRIELKSLVRLMMVVTDQECVWLCLDGPLPQMVCLALLIQSCDKRLTMSALKRCNPQTPLCKVSLVS